MRLTIRLNLCLIFAVGGVSLAFALYQTQSEMHGLRRDLDRQSAVLAESLEKSAEPLVAAHSYRDLQRLADRFKDHERLAGVAVYDPQDQPLAITPNLGSRLSELPEVVDHAAKQGAAAGEYFKTAGGLMHVFALPLSDDTGALGALAVFHDAGFIESQSADTLRRALASVAIQTLLIVSVTLLVLRWGLGQPIERLARWLGDLRTGRAAAGSAPDLPEEDVFRPLKREAARLANSISVARAAAEEEARLRYQGEALWTPERLRVAVESKLGGSRLFAISNREPYEHVRRNESVECLVPASGLVTALEPVLRACEGTWIAQGTGNADAEVVDEHDRLRVPPDHPEYTLRRVWLSPEEEQGFYFGFSNEGLWPLCHIAHTRPVFREQDWEAYYEVNRRFADAFIEEAAEEKNPVVLVQDYHFALVPRMIKEARPDARVAIFWHIPWPNPEAFGICPWQRELLNGLLGADLIGFHLQAHCNNFLESVDRTLESRIDREHFAVNRAGHLTYVHPFPISVTFGKNHDREQPEAEDAYAKDVYVNDVYQERADLLRRAGCPRASLLGIGVDRVDYTKGLPERMSGVERFFEKYPMYRGQFTMVQVGAPSRTHIHRYQDLMEEVKAEVERINKRFQTPEWRPIVFLAQHHSHREILPYYRTADVCLVTSLHDGMNLVAKEFVAAQEAETGALILSRFAGASHELVDALHVNPYDTEELAETIHRALEMSPEERHARMSRMRAYVREHNIYRWAGNLIAELAAVRVEDPPRILTRGRLGTRLLPAVSYLKCCLRINEMRSLLEDWPVVVRRLRQAGSVALFLDFDGTLAPLEEDPRAVVLKSAVRGVLMRLAENPGVSVCVISGRRLADLRARVGVSRISYFGVHGGDTASSAFRSNAVRSLAEARRELMSRLKGVMPVSGSGSVNGFGSNKVSGGVVVEDKGMAFAVHHRRAQAAEVSYAREVLDRVVETFAGELWVVPGDCVWEVLPREIRGKGYAARRHWRLRSAGALPIYIGNDGTDEMAFAALAQGLTARVGAARQTRARYFLRSPADVARFLEKLEEETRWKQSTDSNL